MATAVETPPAGGNGAALHPSTNGHHADLPDSTASILAGTRSAHKAAQAAAAAAAPYVAPPIPRTFKESVSAYFHRSDSAAPELALYRRHTPYFQGATLRNAPNADLLTAFQAVQNGGDAATHDRPERLSATIGTQLSDDGKVGSIRPVDIGSQASGHGIGSWFSSAPRRLINMLEIGTPRAVDEIRADDSEEKVVLLHGYGAGTSFFFQNIHALARHPQSRLYALDWLGMGRSSRVPFHISGKEAKTVETRVEAAESFFVQALEDWRRSMGLNKMTLIGHSLGGYLSIAYSLKYPERVNRLVLVSPAGIPEAPPEVKSNAAPADERSDALAAEVQQSQDDVAPANAKQEQRSASVVLAKAKQARKDNQSEEEVHAQGNPPKDPPRLRSTTRSIVQFLWEANLSPFAILRTSTIWGPMLAGNYTSRRFASLSEPDLRALHAYCYDIFTSRGSSEYCLAHILAPFGYARLPMVNRVTALPKTLSVTFIYGERGIDWMDQDGGEQAVRNLAKVGNPYARCFSVPQSGHHVYLDNPRAFDALMARVLQGKVDEAGKAGQAAHQTA